VGRALARGGARLVATAAGRSERTAVLARRAELELLPCLADVVAAADVVLSIVPPGEAESVALELGGAALFADLNAISPVTAPAHRPRRRRGDLRAASLGGRDDSDLPLGLARVAPEAGGDLADVLRSLDRG
jgi:3-hydroxyisobutyrate dehydrogenase-like beta-hydroxyacid dehydrogenase